MNNEESMAFDIKCEFPGLTVWEEKNCCCFRCVYIPAIEKYFWGSWEVSCKAPFLSLSLLIGTYLFGIIYIFHSIKILSFQLIFLTILFIFAIVSYLKVMIDGPGYLPFYWSLEASSLNQNQNTTLNTTLNSQSEEIDFNNKQDECPPDGIISTDAQFSWAHSSPRPNRCVLSSIGRRIVLRPDHFCSWTSSWIGQRNHKFFFLFLFWSFLYSVFYSYSVSYHLISHFQYEYFEITLLFLISISSICFALIFAVYIGYFLVQQLLMIMKNVTNWEKWNKVDSKRFDKGGYLKNCEDVFGSKSFWFLWLFPISPWKNLTNHDILSTYSKPYKDV